MVAQRRHCLAVAMNGVPVGQLCKHRDGGLSFYYLPQWLQTPGARPVSFSMPLTHETYLGDVVYNFFDNLLPDNVQIRTRIQQRFSTDTNHPFDILSSIGLDCVGAVQLYDEAQPQPDVHAIRGRALSDSEIAALLKGYQTAPLGMASDEDDFRISIAGAQEKTALLKQDGQWFLPHGATPTTHIFKLPIGMIEHQNLDLRDSCENEWLCLQIARAFGLPVCEAEIMQFEDAKALVVKRFDRRLAKDGRWIMRLPQEDMCQALGVSPNLKYESDGGPGIVPVMEFLLGSADAHADRDRFYQSIVLFVLLAGIDGHAKNFSVFIEADNRYRMTPLYDIMSAHPMLGTGQMQSQKLKMAMAMLGQNRHYHWHSIHWRHFISTAKAARYSSKAAEKGMQEMLARVDEVIAEVTKILPESFPQQMAEVIFHGMRRQRDKLLRGRE